MSLTFDELRELGYTFHITGTTYEVTWTEPPPKINVPELDSTLAMAFDTGRDRDWNSFFSIMRASTPKHDDQMDAAKFIWRDSLLNAIKQSPKLNGLSPQFNFFDDITTIYKAPRVVIKGRFIIERNSWRKMHRDMPVVSNMDQVNEVCYKAAVADYMKQKLLS